MDLHPLTPAFLMDHGCNIIFFHDAKEQGTPLNTCNLIQCPFWFQERLYETNQIAILCWYLPDEEILTRRLW
jgi:hypothetical protein